MVVERGSKAREGHQRFEQDWQRPHQGNPGPAGRPCFAEGEGERDIDDGGDRGFSGWKAALVKSQYETQKVLLVREGKVPPVCTVLVVAGPERDLLPQVIDSVRSYVGQGGKALIMAEPEMKVATPNLTACSRSGTSEAGRDVVVDVPRGWASSHHWPHHAHRGPVPVTTRSPRTSG